MSKIYNQNYFYPEDILYQLSQNSSKPVMYIRADGPNACEDISKKEEVWDFYVGKCDTTILSGLMERGELYCYFETMIEASNAFQEWFPQKRDLETSEMDYYIYVNLMHVKENINYVNG